MPPGVVFVMTAPAQANLSTPAMRFSSPTPPTNTTQLHLQAQIDGYITQAPKPSPECCKAAKTFNDQYCR
jgi:hypothetical protein